MMKWRMRARTAVIALTVLIAAGVSTAGWTAQPPPTLTHRAVAGPAVLLDGGARSAASTSQPCFYVFPTCASSDPDVAIVISGTGDTSGCTFSFTVDWGDGKSETKEFKGGPDGFVGATFKHTYDSSKPDSFSVDVIGKVLVNDPANDCTAQGGDLTFVLTPQIGLAGLRFASTKGRTLSTPGEPVVSDNGDEDLASGPDNCDGIDDSKSFDYLACQSPVPGQNGPSVKDWPVIFPVGHALTVDDVVFVANGPITKPVLTASATVTAPGSAETDAVLTSVPMTVKKVGSLYYFEATGLTFTGSKLPATPGRYSVSLSWLITDQQDQIGVSAGMQTMTMYLTSAPYVAPTGPGSDEVDQPYETLVDVGSTAAAGKSGEQAVFKAIWRKFASLAIAHPKLNTASGTVTDGPAFKYYSDDYHDIGDVFGNSGQGCPTFLGFLKENSGHCGNFAQLLAGVLAFQGISAKIINLDDTKENEGFYLGPKPDKNNGPEHYAYMLVGRGLWSFGDKNASEPYPYGDKFIIGAHDKVTVSGDALKYKSTQPIAQGPVTDPPMMFGTGDHAIVRVTLRAGGGGLFDPSYGNPQTGKGYATMTDYEKSAIAGFAVIFRKEPSGPDPLSRNDALDVDCGGSNVCFFQAVPYP